jgi:threonine/homoserine/homoserine lactone efflux protein
MELGMNILGIENILLFVVTGVMLNLYPGPDTLYIVGRSLSQGRGAGIAAALGISSGSIVHTLLGAFGLSAILMTSIHAFTIVKILGCAYLLYQGIMMLANTSRRAEAYPPEQQQRAALFKIYRQGALTNILNPKVAIFFLALLPQFISTSSPSKPLSFIVLGLVFITTGTIWCLVVALSASSLGSRLHRSDVVSKRLRMANGILFILLGLTLATAKLNS